MIHTAPSDPKDQPNPCTWVLTIIFFWLIETRMYFFLALRALGRGEELEDEND